MTSFIDDDGNELGYSGKDFSITKQVISFLSFKIKGNASTNIKLDNTAANRAFLGFYGDPQINRVTKKTVNVFMDGNRSDRGDLVVVGYKPGEDIEVFFMSGNATWFSLWDFYANEIVTTKYDSSFDTTTISASWSKTDGIVYPVADWSTRGDLFTNRLRQYGIYAVENAEATTETTPHILQFVPCLYIHTLLKLLSNHAGTTINGNLFNDGFFNSLTITPESLERWETPLLIVQNRIIKPEHIAPKIKAIDFIKWAAMTFGCLVTFDNESNSIELTMIDKLERSDAEDWSQYYRSHEIKMNTYSQSNFIKNKTSSEPNIADYNLANPVDYGDLLVESDKEDGSRKDVYTSMFPAIYDTTGSSPLLWATPICDLYRLTDDKAYDFSSVSADGLTGYGFAQFNGTGYPFVSGINFDRAELIRVDGGEYNGFHIKSAASTSSRFISFSPFTFSTSGTFYTQRMEAIKGCKVLSCIPSMSVANFWNNANLNYATVPTYLTLGTDVNTAMTAYFAKGNTIYPNLNLYNQGLHYGAIQGRMDIPVSERNLKRVTKILQNPIIQTSMVLPKHKVDSFTFKLIYLNGIDLNGFFLVDSIEHYNGPSMETKVNIVKAD